MPFSEQCCALLQAMGGAKYIFLTHRDDVAEHAKWAKALSAERILHTKETNPDQGTECARCAADLKPASCMAELFSGGMLCL